MDIACRRKHSCRRNKGFSNKAKPFVVLCLVAHTDLICCIISTDIQFMTGEPLMKKSMIVLGLVLLSTGVFARQAINTWTFDNDQPGQIAGDFSNETGEWRVVMDAGAPSKPNVLAQMAKSSASTFNLALLRDLQFRNVDVSVQMKAVAGKSDQGGGLVWRAKDARNYYVVRYNPLEDNFRLYKVMKGTRSAPLQDITIKHADGWHEIRVIMSGERIECYYDGKKYMDFSDATFKEAGKIGLWTKADAQTQFDDLTVGGK
jgi:hypothetical protein